MLADGRASTQAAATEPWPGQLLTLGRPGSPMGQEVAAEHCPGFCLDTWGKGRVNSRGPGSCSFTRIVVIAFVHGACIEGTVPGTALEVKRTRRDRPIV